MRHITTYTLVITSLLVLNMSSCRTDQMVQPPTDLKIPEIEKGVGNNTATIGDAASEIRADAATTKILATEIEKKTEGETKDHATEIKERANNQIENITTIDGAVRELNKLHYKILTIDRYLFEVEEQNKALVVKNKELTEDIQTLNQSMNSLVMKSEEKMMNVLIIVGVVCIVLLGAGIYLMVSGNGPKTGMALIASALLMISLTYFMRQQPEIVGATGGVIFIGFMIALIYQIWVHKKALFETTDTVEKLKQGNWDKLKEEIKSSHSVHTKKLVQEAKLKRLS